MIYLPNSRFQCDVSAGGGMVAHTYPFRSTSKANFLCGNFLAQETSMLIELDPDKLISKFEKAECSLNQLNFDPATKDKVDKLFGFVREDGCEFGISPVKSYYRWEFYGFWNIPFQLGPSDWETFGLIWIPTQMVEFLKWIEKECPDEKKPWTSTFEFGPAPQI